MSLDTSGVLVFTSAVEKTQNWEAGLGAEKEGTRHRTNFRTRADHPRLGSKNWLCNSLAMGSDTLLLPLPFLQQLGQVSLGLQLQELYSGQGTSDCCPLTPGPQGLN